MLKSHKQRKTDFRKLFRDTCVEKSLLTSDYSCAIYSGTPKKLQQGQAISLGEHRSQEFFEL